MLLLLSNINGKELDNVFQLVPTPQKIEVKGGKALHYGELTYLISTHNLHYLSVVLRIHSILHHLSVHQRHAILFG